jgi:AcrR family transcriptional regulator
MDGSAEGKRSEGLGGRRREAARNDRIVDLAAREVAIRVGDAISMTEVARRAGVGIASVYRRYPTKEVLLDRLARAALGEFADAVGVAARTPDPHHAVRRFAERLVERGTGALLPLLSRMDPTSESIATLTAATRQLDELVARGRSAGVIRQDVTGSDLVHLTQVFARCDSGPADRRTMALALDGLLLVAPRQLPEPRPSWPEVLAAEVSGARSPVVPPGRAGQGAGSCSVTA